MLKEVREWIFNLLLGFWDISNASPLEVDLALSINDAKSRWCLKLAKRDFKLQFLRTILMLLVMRITLVMSAYQSKRNILTNKEIDMNTTNVPMSLFETYFSIELKARLHKSEYYQLEAMDLE